MSEPLTLVPVDPLVQPLTLRCGAVLRNRIAKAAMTEGLADEYNRATSRHEHLYGRWSRGGAGLLITGNVQVDRRHLERPGNVVIDDNDGLDRLRAFAQAGTSGGNHLWMQLNHPGRQSPTIVNSAPLAPSAVPLSAGDSPRRGRADRLSWLQLDGVSSGNEAPSNAS
jgi:2,4-dienoyl-CoA reductase-like NADH-dependent reductase (Old Yellow Enzyme family)